MSSEIFQEMFGNGLIGRLILDLILPQTLALMVWFD
jgi:hypothetical protein